MNPQLTQDPSQLAARLKAVVAKRSSVVLGLWGETGIGKSYRLAELRRGLSCQSLGIQASTVALELIRVLRSLDQSRARALPVWAEHLFERLTKGLEVDSSAVLDGVLALLVAVSPVILCVEDLHEVSLERLAWWQDLAQSIKRTRGVGLIVSSRHLPPEPFEAIKLEVMSSDAAKELLEREIGAALPAEALAWIGQRNLGNPLFTLEYFRYLARAGFLWNDISRWRWRVPPDDLLPITVEALIERVLIETATTKVLKQTLEARALLSENVPQALWAAVAELSFEGLEQAQALLESRGLLSGGAFAHPLYRQVVSRGLLPDQRRALARRALTWLEPDNPQAAAEFVTDAELEPDAAVALLERAARASHDKLSSARFLAQAASFASGATRQRLALEAARGLRDLEPESAIRLVQQALEIGDTDPEVVYFLALLLCTQGRKGEADQLMERIPKALQGSSLWLGRRFCLLVEADDFDSASQLLQTQPELLETTEPETAHRLAWHLGIVGDHDQAQRVISKALELPDLNLEQRANLTSDAALILNARGDYLEAEQLFGQALLEYQQAGNQSEVASVLYNRARTLSNLGRFSDMMTDLNQVLHLDAERGQARDYAATQVFIAEQKIEFGDYTQAEEMLLEAREVLRRIDPSFVLVTCEGCLSVLYRSWQPPHGGVLCLKYAHDALRCAQNLGNSPVIFAGSIFAAGAETWQGNKQLGLELAQEALRLALSLEKPKAIALARVSLAYALEGVGELEQARVEYQKAHGLALEARLWLETHKTGLELARLEHNLAAAREHLAWFEQHGLMAGANLARRYFPELASARVSTPLKAPINARLEVLGAMRMVQANRSVPIRGAKRRELLAVLLEARIAGRAEVSQLELIDALYPEASEEDAATAIRQLVFQSRASLGESLILTTANGYALGAVESDAEVFLNNPDLRLWRGAYLEGVLQQNDETVRGALYHALHFKLSASLEMQTSEVVRFSKILLEFDPYNLQAWKLNLQALRAGDNYRGLSKRYLECRAQLSEVGTHLPERWNDFLESDVLNDFVTQA